MNDEKCGPNCDERTACPIIGTPLHFQCGICDKHNKPRHHCGCIVFAPASAVSDA